MQGEITISGVALVLRNYLWELSLLLSPSSDGKYPYNYDGTWAMAHFFFILSVPTHLIIKMAYFNDYN